MLGKLQTKQAVRFAFFFQLEHFCELVVKGAQSNRGLPPNDICLRNSSGKTLVYQIWYNSVFCD